MARTPVKQLFATYLAPVGCGIGDSLGTDSPVLRRFELGAGVLETADLEITPVEDVEATLREAIRDMTALGKLKTELEETAGKVEDLEKTETELEEALSKGAAAIVQRDRALGAHVESLQIVEDVLGKLNEVILPEYERFVTTDPRTTELERFLHRWLLEQLKPHLELLKTAIAPLYNTDTAPDDLESFDDDRLQKAVSDYRADNPKPAHKGQEKKP